MADKLTRSQKRVAREARREARSEAAEAIVEARVKTAIGFGAAYVATQVLAPIVPIIGENQGTIDLGLMLGGGYLAYSNRTEMGDYALGAAMVGATQTLDGISLRISEWWAARQAA